MTGENFHYCANRWQLQSNDQHSKHERRVAYRAMLEAITGGKSISRKAFRKLKIDSVEEYAKAVGANLKGVFTRCIRPQAP